MSRKKDPIAMPDWPRRMTLRLAAAYTGESESGLRAALAKGELVDCRRPGQAGPRFHRAQLDGWVDRLAGLPIGGADRQDEDDERWLNRLDHAHRAPA